jgi:amidase
MRALRPIIPLLLMLSGCTAEQSADQPDSATPALPDLADAGVTMIASGLAEGRFTSEQIVQGYLGRIDALDRAGPRLSAVIEVNPDALDDARRLDAERIQGRLRGPLHGIPVLLKDNIDATGMVNSAGSLALAEHRPERDAHLVRRLRAAGAVILGKTNLSEWANFRSTRSASGWSARGGQTRNPHVLDRSPCGSSAGSAVAVAAGLAPLAVGTETNGSVICPSAVNGVVGIKPTVGRISRHGIIPISPSQDTAGPMATTVADAAALLAAMAGSDPADPASAPADQHPLASLTLTAGDSSALRGTRIGVMRRAMGFHSGVDAIIERAIRTLRGAGAEIIDPADLPTHGQFGAPSFQVLLYEFRPALEAWLEASAAPVRTLDALIAFNTREAGTELRWFGQELFERAAGMGPLSEEAYRQAHADARRLAGPEGIDAALAEHRLDALLTPAVAPAWPIDPVNGDHFLGAGYGAAAVAGYPSITVPAGDIEGLPVGIVFMAGAWSEPALIRIAHGFEQAAEVRLRPSFRPTLVE